MPAKVPILALTSAAFEAALQGVAGLNRPRAAAAYRHVMQTGATALADLPAFTGDPQAAARLAAALVRPEGDVVDRQASEGVIKFITRLADGERIESVLIPDKGRMTLCVSSQVGCRMGCRFCVTGEMGIRRQLTPAEMVSQVFAARFTLQHPVDNVVFMGMGEPLDNFDAVAQALRVLHDQRGLNIAYRRITVSTAGHVDGIRKLAALGCTNLRLAVSIHAADDNRRTRLMPINARYPLEALKRALRDFPLGRGGVLLIEYTLLRGVNDSAADAQALARYLEGLKVRVNVIPYNPGSRVPFVPPDRADIDRFCGWLTQAGLFVRRRHPRGRDVMAACGQLGARDPARAGAPAATGWRADPVGSLQTAP